MPIGDLLASISGQPAAPKRKAEDDIKPAPKLARKTPTTAQPTRPLDRPNGAPKPYGGTSKPSNGFSVKDSLKPMNGANRVSKPSAPTRPAPTGNGTPARPAKKGSYAEIMARAKQAQVSMGQVGKIQHKNAEKKAREAVPKAEPRAVGAKKPVGSSNYQGSSKPGARPPMNGRPGPPAKDSRGRPMGNGKPPGKTAAQEEHDKKPKKAVAATTGYLGTARPKPNNLPSKKNAPSSRGGALLNHAPSRSSKYEDDYDEELDDFIEYDDDEDEPGYGGGRREMVEYDSDASSDMEGGFDDLEIEDRRAAAIARKEDIEEERALNKQKAAKEQRKREYLERMDRKSR